MTRNANQKLSMRERAASAEALFLEEEAASRPAGGPAHSHDEAHALICDQLIDEYQLDRRDAWWRHVWFRTVRDPSQALHELATQAGTTAHRVAQYLDQMGKVSNKSGSSLIFISRKVLAERMRCSITTVARCRTVAVKAGYHSAGIQKRWIDKDDAEKPWKGSASVIALTMPEEAFRAYQANKQAIEDRRRANAEKRRQAKEAELQAHTEATVAANHEDLVLSGTDTTEPDINALADRPNGINAAIARSRRNLANARALPG